MSYYRKGLSITNREQFLQPQGSWQFQYDLLSLSTHISSWQICENDPRLLGIRTSFFLYFLRNFCTAYTADALSDCVNVIVHFAYAVEPHPTGTNLSFIFRFWLFSSK